MMVPIGRYLLLYLIICIIIDTTTRSVEVLKYNLRCLSTTPHLLTKNRKEKKRKACICDGREGKMDGRRQGGRL